MLIGSHRQALLERISTSRVLAEAAEHAAPDRRAGSPGLETAVDRVMQAMERARGLEVEALSFPSGPEHRTFSWSDQRRPFPEKAELWLRTQDGGELLLCRRADNFACSMGALRSTEPEGEILEVVEVGFGTRPGDYRSHRMAGKVALASGHYFEAAMLEALANRRAEGLLCGPGGDAVDATQVVARELGDPELFGEHQAFGFNLSGRQYNRLAQLLAAGETVKVRAVIRLSSGLGAVPAVRVSLPGSDLAQQRVVLVAHLGPGDGPLAAACLEEVMRVLATLAVQGGIPILRRGLDLLVLPHVQGSVAWLGQQTPPGQGVRGALQLSLPTSISAASLLVERPLDSAPSFLPDLLADHLRWAAAVEGSFRTERPMRLRGVPCSLNNPTLPLQAGERPIPSVWVNGQDPGRGGVRDVGAPHGPLHRLIAGVASAALDLCTLGEEDLPRLISGGHLRALRRLARRAGRLRAAARPAQEQADHAQATGQHIMWHAEASMKEGLVREHASLESAARFMGGPGRHALHLAEVEESLQHGMSGLLASLQAELATTLGVSGRAAPRRKKPTAMERRARAVVARRTFKGPLPTPHLLREAGRQHRTWLAGNAGALAQQPVAETLVQWVDGRRNLLEIFDLICLDHPTADLKLLWRYLEALQSAGWIELEEDRRIEEA